ncbi:hypothetical protein [Niabella ginsenosidivorans]|nr:hypothetical protein [Niabella ginsenosidivorans]
MKRNLIEILFVGGISQLQVQQKDPYEKLLASIKICLKEHGSVNAEYGGDVGSHTGAGYMGISSIANWYAPAGAYWGRSDAAYEKRPIALRKLRKTRWPSVSKTGS